MYAVISDIHANAEALTAVLRDIDAQGIDDIVCLGDVVGYGPDPLECVDLVMDRVRFTVLGNHEEALIHGGYGFHLVARNAVDWHRDQLKPGFFSGQTVRRRWEYLTRLPLRVEQGPDLFVHGSPRHPTSEYLLIKEVPYQYEKFHEVFEAFERLLFVGHSHQPCVITDRFEVYLPAEIDHTYRHPDPTRSDQKAIINVGSVGQPRDGDNRACYVVVDSDAIRWRRVPYDFEATARKIEEAHALADVLGRRLKAGT